MNPDKQQPTPWTFDATSFAIGLALAAAMIASLSFIALLNRAGRDAERIERIEQIEQRMDGKR